jgi:hypothetical protein
MHIASQLRRSGRLLTVGRVSVWGMMEVWGEYLLDRLPA